VCISVCLTSLTPCTLNSWEKWFLHLAKIISTFHVKCQLPWHEVRRSLQPDEIWQMFVCTTLLVWCCYCSNIVLRLLTLVI
jgi:hypothetical protein